jgi:hypothetical protein
MRKLRIPRIKMTENLFIGIGAVIALSLIFTYLAIAT